MGNRQKVVSASLVLIFLFSTISYVVPQALANDLPDALSMSYYITPDDPQVINVAQIICGPDFGKTDFWTLRSNVENLYHWVAGSVPHGIPTHIAYKGDQDQWGIADYWQLSNTTLSLGHGDDEDQAILLASLIRAAGAPSWRVRIAQYGVYRLEFPSWGLGLVKDEKERLFTYYAVEIYDISSDPLNAGWWIGEVLLYPGSHDWWTPLHPTTQNLLGWPLPFLSCETLGNSAFENLVCQRRLKPEAYFYEKGVPVARFNYFPSPPQLPKINETVAFDASTSTPDGGYINKYSWNFGDGTSVNETGSWHWLYWNSIPYWYAFTPPNPRAYHAYGTAGTSTVTLTVFDNEGGSNSISKTIEVQGFLDTTPPNIAIISPANTTYTTANIDLNYTVDEPTSWTGCTIDDGAYIANVTIAGNTTLYQFTYGPHNIQLFANDTSGNMGASQKVYFTVVQPPTANFTYDPKGPKVEEIITFDGSGSSSNGGTIVSYEWNFGDGQTASGPVVTHTYANATTYMVTLNVTDNNGLWSIEQKQVQVIQTASIAFDHGVLNLKSKGNWINAYIELPDGYNLSDIEVSSIKLNGTIFAEPEPATVGDHDSNAIPDIMVQFNRTQIIDFILSKGIGYGKLTLTITGEIVSADKPVRTVMFEGSSEINVSSLIGDVNCDGTVGVFDAVGLLSSYGSREGDANWNPNANFAEEWERINLYDVVTLIYHYGQTMP